ncbi:MAG: Rne/Rng family ribonuclease [Bacteroidetes bacterium]|nr:Rne/Rng family ribonuclease [Bacteroidota bacterium]MCE7955314.1 Rne/Rng family ribonuclease [Bacteroidetes bacterium CHB6]MCO5288417.1 Rne/Rng family ribonuclease [Bacteroidota bacterium]
MSNDLIIDSSPSEVRIALLEEKKLVELNSEKRDRSFSVGDIYLGKVKKLMPSLNAAFVDIGYEKDAFLHYLDLGPQFQSLLKFVKDTQAGRQTDSTLNQFELEKDIIKTGKITQVMSSGLWLPVQIAKEPISTKGPRITTEISIAGRYFVVTPFYNHVSVSSKIKSPEERNRLKRLALSIKPKNFGIIVRTVAEGKKVAELDKDIQDVLMRWNNFYEALKTSKPGQKVLGEIDRTSSILRDILNPNFSNIYVNDQILFDEIKTYLHSIAPEQADIIRMFKNKQPIFEHFGIDKQIKSDFGKTVPMQNSAYLVIEHTEAMHVIDVNSGGRNRGDSDSQENNAFETNCMAAREIARQLRLRDMGGIIVIDFIDMTNLEHKKQLYEVLKEVMKRDTARHTILPPSKFGLIQLTRERVRPEMKISTTEKCPSCNGTGEIRASILLMDEIENNLRYLAKEQNERKITLCVHPFLEAYITHGFYSLKLKWFFKYKIRVTVEAVSSYAITQYTFYNKKGEEIKI